MRIDHTGRPLSNEVSLRPVQDKGDKVPLRGCDAPRTRRKFLNLVEPAGYAMSAERTGFAARFPGRADQRPEFHQRLVERGT